MRNFREAVKGNPSTIDRNKPAHYDDGGKYLQKLWDNVEKINSAIVRLCPVEDDDFVITFLEDRGLEIEILNWGQEPLDENYTIRIIPKSNKDRIEVSGNNAYAEASLMTRPLEIADAIHEVFVKDHPYFYESARCGHRVTNCSRKLQRKNRKEEDTCKNEAYKSFSRWANAIEKQSSRLDWTVATPRYKHPSCVWNGDLYCTYTDWDKAEERYNNYVAGVSESPDGKNVSVYVFKTHGDTKDVIMSDVVLKGNIVSAIKKHKEDIPSVLFNEMVKMFDMYSLTN